MQSSIKNVFFLIRRFIFFVLRNIENPEKLTRDQTKVDIVIPTISKDFDVLELMLKSTNNIMHEIDNIFIVSDSTEVIIDFCKRFNCIHIEQTEVLNYTPSKIDYFPKSQDRRGWLYQQILKLNSDKFTKNENFIILDSDTIFNRPIKFFEDSKTILYYGIEWHQPYFKSIKKLLGLNPAYPFSFVIHNMVFNKNILSDFKNEIQTLHKKDWDEAIYDIIDKNETSSFSEYETYATYCIKKYNFFKKKPLFNKPLSTKYFSYDYKSKYKSYHTISFHSYL